ncbi:helix-turn-helix domain-containing protein [Bengtsoniella intestinalis]|uniref:helix-turn-helix domain-containing protein n=1 Tax=Bengtsoniella intestinalis TaxID=3073143 RepID=UPI00391FBF0C
MRKYHDDYEEETTPETQFLTPQEVMDILCIGRNTFYRLVNSGDLKAFRIGKLWRVKREDLEGFGAL